MNLPEHRSLKALWKRLTGATLADGVLQFLRDIEGLATPNESEPDFFYWMQRLPYVGQVAHGGVRAQFLLGHAWRWAKGERPDRVGFRVETKWEEKEHPEAERKLVARFRARVEEAAHPPWLWLEEVRGPKPVRFQAS